MHATHRRGILAAAAGAMGGLARPAGAQGAGWPNGPVRIIVPAPPGAFNDALARLVADQLTPALGQPCVVENRAGAGGSLGTREVAQARPDGQTLGIANTATLAINPALYPNAGYDPLKDLAPLAVCARIVTVLVVSPKLGVNSVQELLALAKARPGKLDYASAGSGGSTHLAFELLKLRAGVDITHVPYRGAAPVVTALLAGDIPIAFEGVPNLLPHLQSGALKALAVTGSARDPALPDVPTLQEAGVPGYEMYVWFGFVASAGVAAPVRERLSREILRIVTAPDTAERIRRQGVEVWARGPEEFAALIRSEQAKFAEVVRVAGIRVE